MRTPHHSLSTLFLDANVLISAAWKDGAETGRVWDLDKARLVTSGYVMVEVQRNLPHISQIERLRGLLTAVELLNFRELPERQEFGLLPLKDRPVLSGAVAAGANYLITGDKKHFSHWFGKTICGVTIHPPSDILTLFRFRE